MDVINSHNAGGRLQIYSDVIEKIAKQACMEVEGVAAVALSPAVSRAFLSKLATPRPIVVQIKDGVAEIQLAIVVKYGTKIPELSERVQMNVKNSVQNMTSITVGLVDVIVTGISAAE